MSEIKRFFQFVMVISVCGCDAVRTTKQVVVLKVHERDTKTPESGSKAELKLAWRSVYSNREDDQIAKSTWEGFKWHEGYSDSEGRARIEIVTTALDSTKGESPPFQRSIAGKIYLIKVTSIDGLSEEAEIEMTPKAFSETEKYVIEIVEIGPPEYVKAP